MSDPAIWGDRTYWAQTAVICAKEFVGVFMFLVAYSRMGMFDTFTGPLVTYMVLVAMAFPFLNSYLVFLMRYGPWYVPSKSFYWGWFFRTVAQYWSVTLCHGLGAWAASAAVKSYTDKWKDATMVQKINGVEMVAPELSYRAVADLGDDDTRFMFFLEEFFAVLILLVGILHLMEAITPNLLQSAFWKPMGGNGAVEFKTYASVPYMLLFQICILLAGVSRAFPSAHLSLHVSVYKACMETNSLTSVCLRIAGGFLAAVVALLYYFVWYVWVGKPEGEKTELGKVTGALYNNLLDKPSALLRSEMFRIPSSMAISIDPHSH